MPIAGLEQLGGVNSTGGDLKFAYAYVAGGSPSFGGKPL